MKIERLNNCLLEVLEDLGRKEVLLFVNGGNAGDSLIAAATYQVMSRTGLNYRTIWYDADVSGKTVIFGGGGSIVPMYDHMTKALAQYYERAERIVILPQTIRGCEELLSRFDDRVYVFCRDAFSYWHCLENCSSKNIFLAHDMAFHLDPHTILESANASNWELVLDDALAARGLSVAGLAELRNAKFFRNDSEKKSGPPLNDVDISQAFSYGVWPSDAEKSAYCFLRCIQAPGEISTDRLHVAIGAHLLGRAACLYDNSYGKNKEVYNHSLRKISKGISFKESYL